MSKRNKPASLTSSLLARKGEAEPAIEPYSFLESNDGGPAEAPARDGAGPVGDDRPMNGSTSAETSGELTAMNASTADPPDGGWPDPGGGHDTGGDGGSGDGTPGADRVEARDRRLLRFVYATAALTGILAVVIYAGGWFFDTPGSNDEAAKKSVQMAPKSPPSDNDRKSETAVSGTPRLKRLKSSTPPPPAPDSPASDLLVRNQAAAARDVGKPSSPRTAEGAVGKMMASKTPKDVAKPSGETDRAAVARPQAEPPAANLPVTPPPSVPSAPERKATAVKPSGDSKAPAPKKPTAVAVATPKTSVAPGRSASGRYLAQLGSVTSAAGAQRFWSKVKKKFPEILGKYDPIVEKRVVANRGTFYRVQVGRFSTFKDVRSLCDLLKKRNQGCLPVKR